MLITVSINISTSIPFTGQLVYLKYNFRSELFSKNKVFQRREGGEIMTMSFVNSFIQNTIE